MFGFAAGTIALIPKLRGEVAGAEEFGFDVVVDAGVEGLVGEAVVIEPDGVATGTSGEGRACRYLSLERVWLCTV